MADLLNAWIAGGQAGRETRVARNAFADQSELRRIAPGIMDGDPAALAAAAAIDPKQAQAYDAVGVDIATRGTGAAKYLMDAVKRGNQQEIEGRYQSVKPFLAKLGAAQGKVPPETFDPAMVPLMEQLIAKSQGMVGATETPTGFRQFEMTAAAAGLQPGTPEYQQAANIALGREGRAATGGFGFEMIKGADGRERMGRKNPRTGSFDVYNEATGEFEPMAGGASLNGGPQASMPAPTTGGGGMVLDDALANAVMQQESGGNPNAVSPAGAQGLMQLMPATQRDPGFGIRPLQNDSPEENVRMGRDYLQAMLKRYNGNQQLALAAYNAGPGSVDQALQASDGNPQAAIARLPAETRAYVPGVQGRMGGQRSNAGLGVSRSPEEQAALTTQATERAKIQAELDNYDEMTRLESERAGLVSGATTRAKMDVERVSEAQAAYPKAQEQARSMVSVIDKALTHPGRAMVTGKSGMIPMNRVPGTAAKDFQVLQNQLEGKAFLEAFSSLKGGGAITEREGAAATAAMARLDTSQSDAEYEAALRELKTIAIRGEARAKVLAQGGNSVQTTQRVVDERRAPKRATNPQTGEVLELRNGKWVPVQ